MKIKNTKPELVLSALIGFFIIALTLYFSVPQKTLIQNLDLIVKPSLEPNTQWQIYDSLDFGLTFSYPSDWGKPEFRSNALDKIIYLGSVVVTKKPIKLDIYLDTLRKQKLKIEEATISGTKFYAHLKEEDNKIVMGSIFLNRDAQSEHTFEISYSYSNPQEKEEIEKFIESIKTK